MRRWVGLVALFGLAIAACGGGGGSSSSSSDGENGWTVLAETQYKSRCSTQIGQVSDESEKIGSQCVCALRWVESRYSVADWNDLVTGSNARENGDNANRKIFKACHIRTNH